MHLPRRRALLPTESKIFTPTALVLLTNLNIFLAFISANLLTFKLLLDVTYLIHFNCGFISGYYKNFAFGFVDWEKKTSSPSCAEELLYNKKYNCGTTKNVYVYGQFFKKF